MISVKKLYLRYVREYYALSGIDLEIEKGQKTAFVGKNGSGKTTLLRVLAKLEKPTEGEVYIGGTSLAKVSYKSDLSVGYVPTLPIYLNKKTVYENLLYIAKQRKEEREVLEDKINKVIAEFKIENLRDEKFDRLSLYEKFLVSFARLKLRKLDLLMVDDIFEKLSEKELKNIVKIIEEKFLSNQELTMIVATSSSHIASKLSNNKVYFRFGGIVASLENEVI